jgi:hypothetical protein
MKKMTLSIYIALLLSILSCSTDKAKKVSKDEVKQLIQNEHDRYQIYYDSSIIKLNAKLEKDSNLIFIGELFKNAPRGEKTYNDISSYKRWDACIKKDEKDAKMQLKDFHISYKSLSYDKVITEYSPNFFVSVAPFVWHKAEIDLIAKNKINTLPIEHWAYKWLNPTDEEHNLAKSTFIHSINFVSPTDTARVNIDFGGADQKAFYELLDSIKAGGAELVNIKSYSDD